MSIDEKKRRAEVTSAIFEDRLRAFVARWGCRLDRHDLYEFQMGLTRLMVDAMRHQSMELSDHLDHMFSQQVIERSLFPVRVIHEEPTR
jgi:hypothetical protein